MARDDNDVGQAIAEFQRRAREMMRAQQEAYLAAVKAWREGASKGTPAWPEPSPPGLGPKPEELAEASYAFAAKLLADQSQFMQELSKTMAKN
ncbi:MAG TPA: hypothetical protein VM692_06525, partial [Gammaproteobacteria bacterium]|nr:hypothetical protein [Gammaproteobacteria bacterium]